MNYYKNSGMKDPFKELSFFISPGLKYLGMNYENEGIIFNMIYWLHSNTTIQMYHTEIVYMYTHAHAHRERERERFKFTH